MHKRSNAHHRTGSANPGSWTIAFGHKWRRARHGHSYSRKYQFHYRRNAKARHNYRPMEPAN